MDPQTYGEERTPLVGALDPARDATELQLTRWAIADGLPVLGLCRGAQVINVAAGGTLFQDIAAEIPGAQPHDLYPTKGYPRTHLAHPVELVAGTRLRDAFGTDSAPVNSMHHQSVKRLGSGLVVSAVAPDGVVEAVEVADPNKFIVGVQWHPEVFERNAPAVENLFDQFIAHAAA
jgi:putative glutamine amidotransferase